MKIERIILKKFLPFIVPDIDVLDYKIDKDMQIILGTNGSGKSKLFEQLSPLPPDNNLFGANGLKEIHIEHLNEKYVLSNAFDSKAKAKHSFFKVSTGEELNSGGTVTVQRELVKEIFNYDDKVHAVLTGKIKFTRLSPSQRKNLLFKVSGINFDYALKLLDVVKSKHRDLVGACKHISGRVSDLKATVSNDSEVEEITKQLLDVANKIDKYKILSSELGSSTYDVKPLNELINKISNLDKMSKAVVKDFDSNFDIDSHASIPSAVDLNIKAAIAESKLSSKEVELAEITNKAMELTSVSSKLDSLDDSEKEGNLLERIELMEAELVTLNKDLEPVGGLTLVNSDKVRNVFKKFLTLKDNYSLPAEFIESGEARSIVNDYNDLKSKAGSITKDITHAKEKLEELIESSCITVMCVKCDHINTIDPEASAENIGRLEGHIKELQVELHNIEALLNKKEPDYLRVMETSEAFNACSMFISSNEGDVMNLLSTLNKDKRYKSLAHLFTFNTEKTTFLLNSLISYYDISVKRNEISKKLSLLKDYQAFKDMGIDDSLKVLEEKHDVLDAEISSLRKESSKLIKLRDNLIKMEEIKSELDLVIDSLSKAAANNLYSDISNAVNKDLEKLELKSITLSSALYNAKHSVKFLEETREELNKLESERKNTKLLLDALSPSTGIIGDNLRSMLTSFVSDVNDRVAAVWNYDMEILPYSNPNELDFKLPFTVIDKHISDISEGSQGQEDIINFAITLCIMDYMKLDNYPVFMDEVGSTFDTAHSSRLIEATNDIISRRGTSQLFMISHHVSHYGGHLNADIVVLSEGNLILPEVYNENVILA